MKIDILCIEDGKMAELKDKILIVDDEPHIARLIEMTLEPLGQQG